jgi:hypothetical protein
LNSQNSLQHHHYYLHHHHHYYQLQQQQQYLLKQQQLQQASLSATKSPKSKSKNKIKFNAPNSAQRLLLTQQQQQPLQQSTSLYSNLKLKNNSYDDSSSSCNATTCSDTTTSSIDEQKLLDLSSPLNTSSVIKTTSSSVELSSAGSTSGSNSHAGLKLKSKHQQSFSKKTRLGPSVGQSTLPSNTNSFSCPLQSQLMEELETSINRSLAEYEQACRLINFDSNIDMIVSLIDMSQYPVAVAELQQVAGGPLKSYNSMCNVSSSVSEDYENNCKINSNNSAVLTLNSLNSFIQTINIPKYVSFCFSPPLSYFIKKKLLKKKKMPSFLSLNLP